MRIDKFLKVSRLIRRRTMAKEVAEQGRVEINGQIGKASSNVAVGDTIAIQFGQKIVTVKVEMIKDTTKKDEAASMYSLISEEMLD